jgi:hypothetical protein
LDASLCSVIEEDYIYFFLIFNSELSSDGDIKAISIENKRNNEKLGDLKYFEIVDKMTIIVDMLDLLA